jgi:hypothetical protein
MYSSNEQLPVLTVSVVESLVVDGISVVTIGLIAETKSGTTHDHKIIFD